MPKPKGSIHLTPQSTGAWETRWIKPDTLFIGQSIKSQLVFHLSTTHPFTILHQGFHQLGNVFATRTLNGVSRPLRALPQ